MSVYSDFEITAEKKNLEQMLKEAGVVKDRKMHYMSKEETVVPCLDLAACNPDAWKKQFEKIVETGVIYIGNNPQDARFVYNEDEKVWRRDYTEEEKSVLSLEPISFQENGDVFYMRNYAKGLDYDVIMYISDLFPDLELTANVTTEGPGGYKEVFVVKGGECLQKEFTALEEDYEDR